MPIRDLSQRLIEESRCRLDRTAIFRAVNHFTIRREQGGKMFTQDARWAMGPDLEQAIERQIVERTGGRLHQLHVELSADQRVVIQGYTSSYYIKQLAIQAALDVMGSNVAAPLQLDIQVGVDPPRDNQGQDWT
jgi:hypothetical protein